MAVEKQRDECDKIRVTTSFLELFPDKCGYVLEGLQDNGTIGTFLIGTTSFNRLACRMIDRLKYIRQKIHTGTIIPFVPKDIEDNIWLADILPKEVSDRVMRFECIGQMYRVLQCSLEKTASTASRVNIKLEITGDVLQDNMFLKYTVPNETNSLATYVDKDILIIEEVGCYKLDAFACINDLSSSVVNDAIMYVRKTTHIAINESVIVPLEPQKINKQVVQIKDECKSKPETRISKSASDFYASSQGLNASAAEFKPAQVVAPVILTPPMSMQIIPPKPIQPPIIYPVNPPGFMNNFSPVQSNYISAPNAYNRTNLNNLAFPLLGQVPQYPRVVLPTHSIHSNFNPHANYSQQQQNTTPYYKYYKS
jgi:hypothetical protein